MLFQKIVDGPTSYTAGGFDIRAPEFEKIKSAAVFMNPETLIGTQVIAGFDISLSGVVATVEVDTIIGTGSWGELAANTDLSAGQFILTGEAI